MTFSVLRVSLTVSMSMATSVPANCGPSSNVVSRTGIPTGPPSVPPIRPSREVSAPSLQMIAAVAPAASAFAALTAKSQAPRLMRATAPLTAVVKSAASQPLSAESMSTGTTVPVTVPEPE